MKFNWIKNTKGRPDSMLTFATISFIVVSFIILLSVIKSLSIKETTINFALPDTTLVLGYLGACFSSYVVRRYHERQTLKDKEENKEEKKQGE